MRGKNPIANISTYQWTLAFCMVNVMGSLLHQINTWTLILLGVSGVWILSGHRALAVRSILGLVIGLIAGITGLWRQSHGLAIGLAVADAVCAVVLLQCYFSRFSLQQSLVFLLKQSVRFETIYVILFGMALVILPQLYKRDYKSRDYDAAMTGLNTEVGPGGVAQLVQSNRVAFMVQFDEGTAFKGDELYWSAARLALGDGLVWRQNKNDTYTAATDHLIDKDAIHQEISVLTTASRVILALDAIVAVHPLTKGISIEKNSVQNYVARGPLRQGALRYEAWSKLRSEEQTGDLTPAELQLFTTLSSPANDRVSQLAASLDLKPGDAMVAAHSIESYFRNNGFSYSLQVGKEASTVSDFLFQAKKGFCEHYAATFAVLMRTLHYPVRLVVGYQGGLKSRVTSKFIIRDQDAHVWTEVWSKKQRRWLRFDPTAAVAPERIQQGSDSLEELSSRPFYRQWLPIVSIVFSEIAPDLLALADAYDNQWINAFLDRVVRIGVDYFAWVVLVLGAFATYLCLKLVSWCYRRLHPDPLTDLYRTYIRCLAKCGVAIEPCDTAVTLSQRATMVIPMTEHGNLLLFAEEFSRLKYSNHTPQSEEIKNLRRLLHSIFQ